MFAFEGELAQRGELRQLAARVPQAALAPATLRALLTELDTASQASLHVMHCAPKATANNAVLGSYHL